MVFLGGQFKSATHGQFKSAQGGQFDRILHIKAVRAILLCLFQQAGWAICIKIFPILD